MQRMTIDLPDDLYEVLRTAAYQHRTSMVAIIREALHEFLMPTRTDDEGGHRQ